MAQKRKQTLEQDQPSQEQKRMKTNRPSNQRAHHNQLMAQAALARINRAKQHNTTNNNCHQHQLLLPSTDTPPPTLEQNHKLEIDNLNQAISNYKAVIESQTTLIDSIKSSLSCNICFEIIDSPYTLLCGHIFCHKDLYAWFHRSNSSSSTQHNQHHHPIPDHQSSDSERIGSALSQTNNPETGGATTTTNENRTYQIEPARQTNPTDQEGEHREGRTGNSNNNPPAQPSARPRPISPRRKRHNLICPQCRAPVTSRPISLYAIKEVTSQLKSSEASSTSSAAIPIPSSSNSNSFRNLVESHRDEKDLTWGSLFPAALPISNSTGATQDLARFIIDPHDGVRRCGRCAWEIGPDGLCAGCGAEYFDFAEDDSESSSDSSFQMRSEESEYMRTDHSDGRDEREESDEGSSIGSARFAWGSGRHHFVARSGIAWAGDEEGSDEEEEPSSGSSDEIRVIGVGGNSRRNVIRVSSDSEGDNRRFGPPSDDRESSTRSFDGSRSMHSRRSDSIHSIRPQYISDDHQPNRLEGDHWRRPTSDDNSYDQSEPDGDPWTERARGPWARGSSVGHDQSDASDDVIIREVVHFRPGSERSFGTPASSEDCDRWSGIHRISSDDDNLPEVQVHGSPASDDDDDHDEPSYYPDHIPSPHQEEWNSEGSSIDNDYY